jgi:hypothetical protein
VGVAIRYLLWTTLIFYLELEFTPPPPHKMGFLQKKKLAGMMVCICSAQGVVASSTIRRYGFVGVDVSLWM